MNYKFGLACVVATSIGSLIGTIVIQRLIKRTGRNSIIILLLSIVLGISFIVIPIHTIFHILEMTDKGINIWQFEALCS